MQLLGGKQQQALREEMVERDCQPSWRFAGD
jgi:hypothetical protein